MKTVYIAGYSTRSDYTEPKYAEAKTALEQAGFQVISALDVKNDIRHQLASVALHANILCTLTGVDHRLVKLARILGLKIGTPRQIITSASQ